MYIVCTQIKDIYQALSGYVIKISLIFYLMNEEIQNMLRYFNENYRTLDFHVCNIREQVHVSKKVVFFINPFLFPIPKNLTLIFFSNQNPKNAFIHKCNKSMQISYPAASMFNHSKAVSGIQILCIRQNCTNLSFIKQQ